MINLKKITLSDFHTHSSASDGELSRIELIRRAIARGYGNICITDHCGEGDLEHILKSCITDCELAKRNWNINALPGIELTHVPPKEIGRLAKKAKKLGAAIVVVHGETIVEPVPEGTNEYSVNCEDVDILAHPGLIKAEHIRAARDNNVFIEITTRQGHCLSNGYIANMCKQVDAKMLLNTDTHSPSDLLTNDMAVKVLKSSGLSEDDIYKILKDNILSLLEKIKA